MVTKPVIGVVVLQTAQIIDVAFFPWLCHIRTAAAMWNMDGVTRHTTDFCLIFSSSKRGSYQCHFAVLDSKFLGIFRG